MILKSQKPSFPEKKTDSELLEFISKEILLYAVSDIRIPVLLLTTHFSFLTSLSAIEYTVRNNQN